mmetsp:Transcript_19751/g.27410  ORF Transcript_19751/g.27410 Transcript_19751/m.27410 type:complete len:170 (+) Transcript_19751:76-585(+)
MVHMAVFDAEFGRDIQKCGIVLLGGRGNLKTYPFDTFEDSVRYTRSMSIDYSSVLPMKSVAIHLFPPNLFTLAALESLLHATSQYIRQRISVYNIHQPEHNFARLYLCSILPEHVPPELGGTLDYDYLEWIRNALFEELYVARVDCMEDDEWERRVPEIKPLIDAVLDR